MNIIDIKDLRMRRAMSNSEGYLREFEDYYEYCYIEDYEMKYNDFKIDSIQAVDLFVSILESNGKFILVSLQFPKTYDVHEIVEWLDTHQIGFNQKDKRGYYIDEAESIDEIIVYKDMPIVFASRGHKKLYYDTVGLEDVTRSYDYYTKIINTGNAERVEISDELQKENKGKKKYSLDEMWVDDMDKDDWMDDWINGKGYPGHK